MLAVPPEPAVAEAGGAPPWSPTCAPVLVAPVDGRPSEGFELPDGPYGPGNRGLTWQVAEGTPVRAPVSGTVTFAGRVVDRGWVTIRPDGDAARLVTVGDLVAPGVGRGAEVVAGTVLGTSGPTAHLGVRSDGVHLDPAPLLEPRPAAVRLVADQHFGDGGGCRGDHHRRTVVAVSPPARSGG